MAGITINNIDDLKSEIARLEIAETQQSAALRQRISSPSALFAAVLSIFPKSATLDGAASSKFFNQDFVGLISRFLLPFTLNKTIFRNSNFITKALISVLSQKASSYINEDSVGGIWSKIKSVVGRIGKKKPEPAVVPVVQPVVVVTEVPK